MVPERRDQNVHMVGHHAPGMKMIAFPVEVLEGIYHQPGHVRVCQQTRAITVIERSLDAPASL